MEAALLFVDMSGFTPLTEGLSSQGDMGIEKLSHILNEYFGQITDAIAEHDGDVIKFAGDAVLVLFAVPAHPSRLPLDTGTDQPISDRMRIGAEETLADLVLRAAHCAMDLHSRFHRYTVGEAEKGIVLKLHSAISAGSVWGVHVGIRQRWEYLLKGDPLEQLGLAMHVAGHGEVALSPEAYNAVADRVTVDRALRLLSIELKHHPHYVRLASLGGAVTTDILPSSSPMLQTSVPNFAGVHEPPGTSLAVFKKHARARMTHSGETVQTLSSGYHTPVHSVVGHNFELPSLPSLPSLLSLASLPTVPANSSEKNKKNNVSGDGDDDGAETRGMYEVQGGGEGERKARTSGGNGSTSKQKKSIFKPGDGGVGDCDGGNGGLRVTLPTSTVSSVSTGTTPGSVNNRFISGLLTSSVHPDRDGPMHGDGVRAGVTL
jgi:class 3 adenylate cyclase